MTLAEEVLTAARTVLVVDWPTPDVPAGLARAGLRVFVKGGPGPDRYTEYRVAGDEVVVDQVGHPPDQADLVYAYRPLAELPGIVALARDLGAGAVWTVGEDEQARAVVEGAGLHHLGGPDIVEAVRRARGPD